MGLRVATLNCWHISPPFEERMALVRAEIAALEPDVVGFQEIIERRDGFNVARVAVEGLGYHVAFGAASRWNQSACSRPNIAPQTAFAAVSRS